MPYWFILLTVFSILAFGLLGGIFLAFSDFIMRSLRKADGNAGMVVMQSINREVFRYVFIPMFLAMVPVSLVLAVSAHWMVDRPVPYYSVAGIYVFGAFFVTMFGNVPMNNTLERLDADTQEGMAYWQDRYIPIWTRYNSIRAGACLVAAAILLFAISGT